MTQLLSFCKSGPLYNELPRAAQVNEFTFVPHRLIAHPIDLFERQAIAGPARIGTLRRPGRVGLYFVSRDIADEYGRD